MTQPTYRGIAATYLRGGTSKGVFFLESDLPDDPVERDAFLLRAIGSPDPYGKQIDGMGAATSSTSKVIVVSPGGPEGCDLQYAFGQVAIDRPLIDWSGNCGNLTAAVAPFALWRGLLPTPDADYVDVMLWQRSIHKRIEARVPIINGQPAETGSFWLDGVAFGGAEIRLSFLDPGADGALFPTGNVRDWIEREDGSRIEATLINAGNPSVFVRAQDLGLTGFEHQADVNGNAELLKRCEAIRARGAVMMGLADDVAQATAQRPAVPKLAFFASPGDYRSAAGRDIQSGEYDLSARILSMGALHHAMTGTGIVAIAAAAAIPGTVVADVLGASVSTLTFGHPSGTTRAGAVASERQGQWEIERVTVSRSARRLMTGTVFA